MYLFYGLESFLIEKEIKKIIEDNHFSELDITTYSLYDNLLDNILDDALTLSLFSPKKLIIVKDAYIFTGLKEKGGLCHSIEKLEEYMNHDNPNAILVFQILSEKLDERKKIVKQIKKVGQVKECSPLKNLDAILNELLPPYKMDPQTRTYFLNRVGNDIPRINQELQKLKIYKDDNLNISLSDVTLLTSKTIDLDLFKFLDHIILKHKKEALTIYHALLLQKEEPIKIIVMLANQIRLMYQSKELVKEGYSEIDIAKEIGAHPYSVKLALQKSRNYTKETLLDYLYQLGNLDLQIKSGIVDKSIAFELFLIQS